MKAAGYNVRPFAEQQTFGTLQTGVSPIVGRPQSFWSLRREQVVAAFPEPELFVSDVCCQRLFK